MGDGVLWKMEAHTRAKHEVLRRYLEAWYPKLAFQSQRHARNRRRLLVVDGFAGPGRYLGGEPGSPIIMVQTLLDHSRFDRWADVEFEFRFFEDHQARYNNLIAEVANLGDLPANVRVETSEGAFEPLFENLVIELGERVGGMPSAFAFIDPFGYSTNRMSLTGRFLDFQRCETLTFLPLEQIYRFVETDSPQSALTTLFGGEEWRGALDLEGNDRKKFLLALFQSKMAERKGVKYTTSMELRTQAGNEYRLVFGVSHIAGLEIAKDAMWKVDPVSGTRFVARRDKEGQEVLFSEASTLDFSPIVEDLRRRFGSDWFTITAAEEFVLIETPFRKQHVRTPLGVAEKAGQIDVVRSGERGFPEGTQIRFRSQQDA